MSLEKDMAKPVPSQGLTNYPPKVRNDNTIEDSSAYDEMRWNLWPKLAEEPPYSAKLLSGLASNSFNTIGCESLPVSVLRIVEEADNSDTELLVEAIGCSIVARNLCFGSRNNQ